MKKEELLKRTKKELLALAHERGTRLSARLRKAELVDQVLSLFSRRRRSPSLPADKKTRSPRKRSGTSASRQRRSPSRKGSKSVEPAPISREELHRISEAISRCFPRPFEKTEIVLLDVDPFHAHVFWHVNLGDLESARQTLGGEGAHAALLLRFYDVTLLDFDGGNAHSSFDVAVHSLQSTHYIDFWESGRSYIVDIGLRTHDGRFQSLARSNPIELPPHAPSSNFDRTGIVVDPAINIVCEVADVTRAEVLADIRPEPRPDMEPDASDDLVRSFYRRLTDQRLPGAVRRKRAPSQAGPYPESAESEQGEDRSGGDGAPITGAETEAPRQTDRAGAEWNAPERFAGASGRTRNVVSPSWDEAIPRSSSEPSPRFSSQVSSAESSYGLYEARGEQPGVSSWISSAGGVSSWVTSPGGAALERMPLEQVFVLPSGEWKQKELISELASELLIQGRAAPGSQFSLLGQPVRVRPDGTFSVRARLPEGTLVVPVPQRSREDETPDAKGEPS